MALAITSRSSIVVTPEKLWAIFSHGCDQRRRERSGNKFHYDKCTIGATNENEFLEQREQRYMLA